MSRKQVASKVGRTPFEKGGGAPAPGDFAATNEIPPGPPFSKGGKTLTVPAESFATRRQWAGSSYNIGTEAGPT